MSLSLELTLRRVCDTLRDGMRLRMTSERLFHYLAVIAALHAVLLSLSFGLRHL
jgi:hypothetical protein